MGGRSGTDSKHNRVSEQWHALISLERDRQPTVAVEVERILTTGRLITGLLTYCLAGASDPFDASHACAAAQLDVASRFEALLPRGEDLFSN